MSIHYKNYKLKKILSADQLNTAVKALDQDLGGGLVATDIWSIRDSRIVAFEHNYGKRPEAVALLNEVTKKLDKTLKGSGYPGLGNYYFISLIENLLLVVLTIDTYQQFILVDLSKTSMGILMNAALPNLLNKLAQAEAEAEVAVQTEAIGESKQPIRQFLGEFTKGT